MKLKTIKEIPSLKNKRVLLRCDFNVPIRSKACPDLSRAESRERSRRVKGLPLRGITRRAIKPKVKVANGFKIDVCIPSIKYLQRHGAIVIIVSHLGRPQGRQKKELSLFPIAEYLSKKLGQEVLFVEDCLDQEFADSTELFEPGEIILLENLRFYPGEEKNYPLFAKKLSGLADIYINDAFASSHRKQASISAITKFLPSYAGLNLENEVSNLSQILSRSKRPILAIIGGSKISTKIKVIENLAQKVDLVILGGALANNFIKVIGYEVGQSVIDRDYLKPALKLLNHKKLGSKIIIPFDVRVATGLEFPRQSVWRSLDQIKKDEYILDIGPRTQRLYSKLCRHAKMILWNGPLGFYENKHFRRGSYAVAKAIARSQAASVVGGGETLDILKRLHLFRKIDFVSTGGGAMLEFLEGKVLPGIKPLIKY